MRLAIVVPRYGPEIVGGAETLARGLAEHTAAAGLAEVDVLTSCVRDHQTWRNEFPAGAAPHNGVTVRRFPAVFTPAQAERWRVIHERLILNRPVTVDEQYEWVDQSAHLPGLYAHLLRHGAAYDRLIFLPYLFGPTYYGSALFPERSIICPCLHDELYAYIQPTQDLFAGSRGIMFNSEPERQLAERLFGRHPGAAVVGLGLEPFTADADAARQRFNLRDPFLLYAGRLESPKNVPLLLRYFMTYKARRPHSRLKLALIGQGELQLPRHPDIRPLGFQSEADKRALYAAAAALVQPSVKESFSIVIMEAWLAGAPVLVHTDCAVTRHAAEASQGGLAFGEYSEFEAAVDLLLARPTLGRRLAANGAAYVRAHYSWPAVLDRFAAALRLWQGPAETRP